MAGEPQGLLREGLLLATGATLGVALSLCLRRPTPAGAAATSGGDDGPKQEGGQQQDRKPYIAVLRDGTAQARADAALSAAYDRVRNGVSPRPWQPLSLSLLWVLQAADPQEAICAQDGTMDNVMSIHSLNPATLDAHAALYIQCMKGESPLSRAEREIVAVAASRCNRCRYCARQRLSVALLSSPQPSQRGVRRTTAPRCRLAWPPDRRARRRGGQRARGRVDGWRRLRAE